MVAIINRLVRGGEQIEILDRNTPLARIIHISQVPADHDDTPWIKEVEGIGIVSPPRKKGMREELLTKETLISTRKTAKSRVLEALLEERETGR